MLHVSENVIIYTCHWFIGPSRNKPFGSEFSDSNRKSGKVDYVTDNIVGHWPVCVYCFAQLKAAPHIFSCTYITEHYRIMPGK